MAVELVTVTIASFFWLFSLLHEPHVKARFLGMGNEKVLMRFTSRNGSLGQIMTMKRMEQIIIYTLNTTVLLSGLPLKSHLMKYSKS